MNRIIVKNFGPIKDVDLSLTDFNVFIGAQASGKSTLAKLLYFFLSLKDDIMQSVVSAITANRRINTNIANLDLKKKLRSKFVQSFGTTKHLLPFCVTFYFDINTKIILQWKDGFVNVDWSEDFERSLSALFNKANVYMNRNKKLNMMYASQNDFIVNQTAQRQFLQEMGRDVNTMLGNDDRVAIYVPACRSLLATLSEYIYKLIAIPSDQAVVDSSEYIPDSILDYTSKAFVDRIVHLRSTFTQSLSEIVKDKISVSGSSTTINTEYLDDIISLISKILKGEYRYGKDGEKLYYNKKDYVKLSLASSGQQEVVWILQLIFSLVLNNTHSVLLIEEPEAHLFTEAQMYIVWLIALFSNINGNRVIITTHSPYILSATNNLLYANEIGKEHALEANVIIPKQYWLDPSRVSAYIVNNNIIESIINKDIKQIEAERIDEISTMMNVQYDKLSEL